MPAARCKTPLRILGLGVRRVATIPPTNIAVAGKSAKSKVVNNELGKVVSNELSLLCAIITAHMTKAHHLVIPPLLISDLYYMLLIK